MHTSEEIAETTDSISEGGIRPRMRMLQRRNRLRICAQKLKATRALLRRCRRLLANCKKGDKVKRARIKSAASKIARKRKLLKRQALALSPALRRRAARMTPALRARRAAARRMIAARRRRRFRPGMFRGLLQSRPSAVRGIGVGHDDHHDNVGRTGRRTLRTIPVATKTRLLIVGRGRAALQWQLKNKKWLTLGLVLRGKGGKPTFRKTYAKFRMQPHLWKRILQVLQRVSGKSTKTAQRRFAARKQAVQRKAMARRRGGTASVRTGAKGVIPISQNTFLRVLPGGRVFYLFSRRKGGRFLNLGAIRVESKGLVWIGRMPRFRPSSRFLESIRTRLPGKLRTMPFVEVPAKTAKAAAQAQQRGASPRQVATAMRRKASVRLPARQVAPPPPPPVSPHVPPEASPGAVAPEAVLRQRQLPSGVKARRPGKPIPKQAVPLKIWPVKDPRYLAFLGNVGATAWYPYGPGWNTAPWHFADLKGDAPFDSFDDANEEVSYHREAVGAV